jgi:NitT/TauT family transport system substrate-binding protein
MEKKPAFRWVFCVVAAAVWLQGPGAPPARAQGADEVRIGYGFGIGFLPLMVMDRLKLIERHSQATVGRTVMAKWSRFSGSAAMQDAILAGSIDLGGYGVPGLLLAWEKTRNVANHIVGLAGITTTPLVLLSANPAARTLGDLGPKDRIAMPSTISPQMYVLQMASEKVFGAGKLDALKPLVVSMPHPEALSALLNGTEVTGYFSTPPFTQIALKNPKVHQLLSSPDVMGRASFLVFGVSAQFADAHAELMRAIVLAIDEAARYIAQNPRQAAEIYLEFEPSKTLDLDFLEELAKDPQNGFGAEVYGVKAYADFMVRLGQLKTAPARWQDVFLPVLAGRAGS